MDDRWPRGPWRALVWVALVASLGLPSPGHAAAPTPEFQKRVRAATFEVVMPKATEDGLTYETPLPLDLIPYSERIDRYWSIGTAVAIGPNTFVSAGHVIAAGAGRTIGPPALRDSDGNVYAIDRVLQYSLPEDYVVFSLDKPPATLQPLATSTTFDVDDVVFAVGNALGEGVVIRDGLLTSLTPEDRNGRWKWLRFSAATSPGNSGGPLLDSEGRVLGIVVAKSPNENLNYALPIERVLQGSTKEATFEVYEPFRLPMLRDSALLDYQAHFPLPASYAGFSQQVVGQMSEFFKAAESKLLAEQAARLFPKGDTAEFFAASHRRYDPTLVAQQDDKSWGLLDTNSDFEAKLSSHGRVWNTLDPRVTLFRIVYPEGQPDTRRYEDSKEFMDLLLKGLRLQRLVGTQPVRITSLGPAAKSAQFKDAHQRVWQVRSWPLGFIDSSVIVYALPTPDGYVGMAMQSPPAQASSIEQQLRHLADFYFVSLTGTLPQWRTYLARRDLRAGVFAEVQVTNDPEQGFRLRSPRLALDVARDVMAFDDRSRLNVLMSYVPRGGKISWEPVGTLLERSPDNSDMLRLSRQSKPADGVSRDIQKRWDQMTTRTGDFSGQGRRDESDNQYWFRTVAAPSDAAAAANVLYEVEYSTFDPTSPRELEARRDRLLPVISVKEP
ncbi:MAG: trypsin-like peptidase domain-containing protein [Proteobacteria bacterium]|nr:trypsin-like peptidase domain-containing protein [Pseudomonadota bacterium]